MSPYRATTARRARTRPQVDPGLLGQGVAPAQEHVEDEAQGQAGPAAKGRQPEKPQPGQAVEAKPLFGQHGRQGHGHPEDEDVVLADVPVEPVAEGGDQPQDKGEAQARDVVLRVLAEVPQPGNPDLSLAPVGHAQADEQGKEKGDHVGVVVPQPRSQIVPRPHGAQYSGEDSGHGPRQYPSPEEEDHRGQSAKECRGPKGQVAQGNPADAGDHFGDDGQGVVLGAADFFGSGHPEIGVMGGHDEFLAHFQGRVLPFGIVLVPDGEADEVDQDHEQEQGFPVLGQGLGLEDAGIHLQSLSFSEPGC